MNTHTSIGIASFSFLDNVVSTLSDFTISFTYPIPTELNCFIEITFPNDLIIPDTNTLTYKGTGFFQNGVTSDVTSVTWIANVMRVEACQNPNTIQTTLTTGPLGSITIQKMYVPGQVKQTNPVQIKTYYLNDYNDNTSLISQGDFVVPADAMTTGTIAPTSFVPNSAPEFLVQHTGATYQIKFTPSHQLFFGSKIIIYPPQKITTNLCNFISNNAIITGTPSCTKTSRGWEVTNLWLDNGDPNTPEYIPGNEIQLVLGIGTNPESQQNAGEWSVLTQNQISGGFFDVDFGTSTTSFMTTIGSITLDSVTSTSYTTGVRDAVYTFSITPDHYIPSSGYIEIQYPSDVLAVSLSNCKYGLSQPLAPSSCAFIPNGFRIKIVSKYSPSDGPLLIEIGTFQNPRTYQQSGSFTITTYDSQFQYIDSGSGLSLTMNTKGELDGVGASKNSQTNGVASLFTITLTSNIMEILNGDSFYITFPPELTLTLQACAPIQSVTTVQCTSPSANVLKAQFLTVAANTGTFRFTVSSAKNAASWRPTSTFTDILLEDSNGFHSQKYSGTITVNNTIASTINPAVTSLLQSSDLPNTKSYFTITFFTTNEISTTGSIILNYPQQIIVDQNSVCNVTTTQTFTSNCQVDQSAYSIQITNVFPSGLPAGQKITILVEGLLPFNNTVVISNFYFQTYDDPNFQYKIDELTERDSSLTVTLQCDFPCRQCIPGIARDFCSSCWSASDGLSEIFLQGNTQVVPVTQTCQKQCNSGYTSDGSNPKICKPCLQNCSSCIDNATVGNEGMCINCNISGGFNHRFENYTCLTECPEGYYVSSTQNGENICSPCKSPCKTCNGTDTNCTSCETNSNFPILFNEGCVGGCPSRFTRIWDDCVACQSPCLECSESSSFCTSCDGSAGRQYLFSNQCNSQCPVGTILNVTTLKCDGCLEGCNICDTKTQAYCIQCTPEFVNLDGSCEVACPENYLLTKERRCQYYYLQEKPEVVNANNTIYIPSTTVVKYINITEANGTISTIQITNTTFYTTLLPLIYFPHLIGAGIAVLISVFGYIKDRDHALITNIILLIGPIELLSYLVQTAFSYFQTTLLNVVLMAGIAFVAKIILNITFWLFYHCLLRNDATFEHWRIQHRYSTRCISCMGCTLSFKMYRMLYSYFYGIDKFKAEFDRPKVLKILVILYTVMNWLFCYGPIVYIDVICVILDRERFFWGTQLYICMIETFILSVVQFILCIVEFVRINKLIDPKDLHYKEVMADSVMEGLPDSETENEKINHLKLLLEKYLPKNRNNLDELRERFGERNCQSEEEMGNELEDDPRKTRSYPMTPNGLRQKDIFGKRKTNNVYAEGKNPTKTKEFADKNAQAYDLPNKLRIDLPMNDDSWDDTYYKRTSHKRRGRKNEFYNQIDEEDDNEEKQHIYDDYDEEIEFQTPGQDTKGKIGKGVVKKSGKSNVRRSKKFQNSSLDMIEEENDKEKDKDKQKSKKKKKQESPSLQKKFEREKKLLEEEKKIIEQEKKKLQDELIRNRVTDLMQQDSKRNVKPQKKQKVKKPNTTKADKLKVLDSERGFDSTLKEENLLLDDNEESNWKQKEYEDILKGLEEENLQKEIEEQKKKEQQDKEVKELEQQIQEENDRLLKEQALKDEQERFQAKMKEKQIQQQPPQVPQTVPKVSIKAQDILKDQESLPIPERPRSAQAKSEHSQSQEVLIPEGSLVQFKQNNNQIEAPPNIKHRNFNVNDVLGSIDFDEMGNMIPIIDENGNLIDKNGKRVNQKGYLIDPETGNIIEKEGFRTMFDQKILDANGEIPAPLCFEKYNFNPHQILGDFDYNPLGQPIIQTNSKGQNIDKKGREVNENGFLVDPSGNIIDNNGRIKIDKKQIEGDEQLPLINYNRKKYYIQDIIGQFTKDPKGEIILKKNDQGEFVDETGKRVNERGYLIDRKGNIIDQDGKKVFDAKNIKNGEPPKIFKFSKKIKPSKMRGNFDLDPIGNPVLFKNEDGHMVDKDGNRVNEKGYLVDDDGNVIDKRGKKVFNKELLDNRGNIPKVYLRRRIETDSESSLSRLMSEIEKDLQSERDPNEKEIQRKIAKLQAQIRQSQKAAEEDKDALDSGHTSVDSQMEDTPSNYNLANQRYDHMKRNLEKNVDQIEEELSDIGSLGPDGNMTAELWSSGKKKRRRRRRRLFEKIDIYLRPTERDILMANAYGGQPIPRKVTKVIPVLPRSRKQNRSPSQGSDIHKDNLSKLTHVLAGSQIDRGDDGSIRDQFNDNMAEPVPNNFYPQKDESRSLMGTSDLKMNQSIKQSRILRDRRKQRDSLPMASKNEMMDGEAEFEKMFGKNLEDMLDDSDWDLGSLENMSRRSFSRGNVKSAMGQARVKDLEAIYLNRIDRVETSQKKSRMTSLEQTQRRKPRMRVNKDKYMEGTQQLHEFLEPIKASMGNTIDFKKQRQGKKYK